MLENSYFQPNYLELDLSSLFWRLKSIQQCLNKQTLKKSHILPGRLATCLSK